MNRPTEGPSRLGYSVTQSSHSRSSNGRVRVIDRHRKLSWHCLHIPRFAANRPGCMRCDVTAYEIRGSGMSLFSVHSLRFSTRVLPALLLLLVASSCSLDTQPQPQANPITARPRGGAAAPLIPGGCQPDCTGRTCGPDGCNGSCGDCRAGTSCHASGTCIKCAASCEGRSCGDDRCGGSCGTCRNDTTCDEATGKCECVPQCGARDCGPDGCKGVCGTCADNQTCSPEGMCECRPNCGVRQCGDDGCGGSCGTCDTSRGLACNAAGQCGCVPDCRGDGGLRECGPDGCDGECGRCTRGTCDNRAGLCR